MRWLMGFLDDPMNVPLSHPIPGVNGPAFVSPVPSMMVSIAWLLVPQADRVVLIRLHDHHRDKTYGIGL